MVRHYMYLTKSVNYVLSVCVVSWIYKKMSTCGAFSGLSPRKCTISWNYCLISLRTREMKGEPNIRLCFIPWLIIPIWQQDNEDLCYNQLTNHLFNRTVSTQRFKKLTFMKKNRTNENLDLLRIERVITWS